MSARSKSAAVRRKKPSHVKTKAQRFLEGARAIGHARFRAGERVRYTFEDCPGYPNNALVVTGTIIGTHGRFLATPAMAEWTHDVRMDGTIMSCDVWRLPDLKLEAE